MSDILERIEDYLVVGGLFNPELMDPDAVRDIIIESRREILSLRDDNKKLKYRLSMMKKIRNEKVFEKLVNAMEKIEGLERNLKTRDEFLVKNDMWMKFVGEL